MKLEFKGESFQDLIEWVTIDKKVARKILDLLKDIENHPFEGLGKPEPLKYLLSGFWSRRIDLEHRLIYKVEKDIIIIISCKFHYK